MTTSDGAQIVVHDAETGARLSTLALPAALGRFGRGRAGWDEGRVRVSRIDRSSATRRIDVVKIWDWERNDVVAEIPIDASASGLRPGAVPTSP